MRRLPARGFTKERVYWNGVVERHRLDDRELAMRAAYNAGLADAIFELGEFSKRRFPVPENLLQKIRDLQKYVSP
jgi:hypothetical protein